MDPITNKTIASNTDDFQRPESIDSSRFRKVEDNLNSLEQLERKDRKRKINWFTIRTILTSGAGFFTDSYDVFIINLVMPMIGYVYYSQNNNKVPADIEGVVKGMASVGTLIGQLVFGFMGDIFGRKIYGFELLIIIIGTINCATSSSTVRGVSVLGFLGLWRFILGIGIGGDYPMSATITSEWSATGKRGMMMALIFSMQGIGNLAAAIVTIILLAIFKQAILADMMNLDYVWRLCIGLGAVPAVATIYLRFTMPESPRYALNVKHDLEEATAAMAIKGDKFNHDDDQRSIKPQKQSRNHWAEFRKYFKQWRHLKVLLGTSLSWFFLDIAFYGLGLNNSYVLSAIGLSDKPSPFETLWWNAVGQVIITVLGSVPGYYLTVIFIERWGRRTIQIMGFSLCTILFVILSAAYYQLRDNSVAGFIAIFTLAQLFQNFGANSTTFIIPGEVFPTKVRASAHGISAASGKAGAIIASFAFNVLVEVHDTKPGQHAFLPETLGIFAAIMFLGLVVTILWVPESKGKDLQEFEEQVLDDDQSIELKPAGNTTSDQHHTLQELSSKNQKGQDSTDSSTEASTSDDNGRGFAETFMNDDVSKL
ncbi:MAG: major facilitator superfamily domain-containing protein [Benjaminiella poitrasii]|nr:MAG: major facilitator superfamily domain-containing protein [Benjaminiella poitrasii]